MKAVLVIDIPYVDKKQINYLNVSFGGIPHNIGRDEMVLRPLPHKLQADWYTDGYKEGFNACLEEITGETECTTQKKDT